MPEKPDVSTPNIAYLEMIDDLELVGNLIGGTGAMRAARTKYLPREPKESLEAYNNRLARSVLFNAFADTINKLVGKPFSKPVNVTPSTPEIITQWSENIDKCGNNLTNYCKTIFQSGLVDGVTHILVDYPAAQKDRTLEAEQQADIRPYAIHIKAENLIGWQSTKVNGIEVLSQIRIKECCLEPDGQWGEKQVERIRVIYTDRFEIYQKDEHNKWNIVEQGEVSLGKIPLVTFYTRKTSFLSGKPPLLDQAYLNVQHWQSYSDLSYIVHFVSSPVLLATGFDDVLKDIELGPNRVVRTNNENANLRYVEHSGAAIEAATKFTEEIKSNMDTMGMQLLIKRPGNVTATASVLDTAKALSPLEAMAKDLENAMDNVFQFMAEWVHLKTNDAGGININKDFGISLADAADKAELLKARIAGEISQETYLTELKRRDVLQGDFNVEEEIKRLSAENTKKDAKAAKAAKKLSANTALPPANPATS